MADEAYLVEDLVGEGRFARVHKGYCISNPSQVVAIRILKVVENAAVTKKKLVKEAEELSKLQHDNIVKTYGVLVHKNAFIQEYCAKVWEATKIHSLLGLINTITDDFPLQTKVKCFKDVTNALTYLHSLKIVVSDLKPANVLVTATAKEDWVFKLADIAPETRKRNNCSSAISSCIQSKGDLTYTAAYLAPELMQFNPDNFQSNRSTACDIYSFAILMFQVIFPAVPLFEDMHPFQFMMAISKNWRPSIPSFSDSRITVLVEIMKLCWSSNPSERPVSKHLFTKFKEILLPVIPNAGKRCFFHNLFSSLYLFT